MHLYSFRCRTIRIACKPEAVRPPRMFPIAVRKEPERRRIMRWAGSKIRRSRCPWPGPSENHAYEDE